MKKGRESIKADRDLPAIFCRGPEKLCQDFLGRLCSGQIPNCTIPARRDLCPTLWLSCELVIMLRAIRRPG